ncbi:MAG TPA: hypothetical protein VFR29_06515 [Steroidobacteraceae bacterium]|nr:hypothetical protein [Steroidobacteraceae bacterium]
MLAYVFWHHPRPQVRARDYEILHQAFHEALWEAPLPGLVALRVHRLARIPWLSPPGPGYEDWHLIADSAALDGLNEAAVTSARRLPHDRIAAQAAAGTAGLYGLRLGAPMQPAVACWMPKPAGMSYADFDASMQPLIARGCCLWGRRMTLGPTPEFCLHAPAGLEPPAPAEALPVDIIWSRGPR